MSWPRGWPGPSEQRLPGLDPDREGWIGTACIAAWANVETQAQGSKP